MIVVKLMGGLGNQMFEYAAARSLALRNNAPLFLDLEFLLDRTPRENYIFRDFDLPVFNLEYAVADQKLTRRFFKNPGLGEKILRKISGNEYKYYHEPHFHFDPVFTGLKGNQYIEGYFQSEKYFIDHADDIRLAFRQSGNFPPHVMQLVEKIRKDPGALCLHVRRTDFVTNPVSNAVHGVLDESYYSKAIKRLESLTDKISVYVFSDDISWCKKQLKFDHPTYFVEDDYAGVKCASQFYLMRSCRNFIIPNSSFSWWTAWLGNDKNKIVIAPERWFTDAHRNSSDVIPASWISV